MEYLENIDMTNKEMNEWQKCPVCNGTGRTNDLPIASLSGNKCRVCDGRGIINTLTGNPPKDIANAQRINNEGYNNYKEYNFTQPIVVTYLDGIRISDTMEALKLLKNSHINIH